MNFCPRCGAQLTERPPTRCQACGYQMYVNARPTVGLVIVDGGRFLAVRRAADPQKGLWELPGGFCDGWEHPADAALREAREELGVEVLLGDFIGMYIGSYEFQDETVPVLDMYFRATLPSGAHIVLDPAESSELTWFPLADPPPLAFAPMDAAVARVAREFSGCRAGEK